MNLPYVCILLLANVLTQQQATSGIYKALWDGHSFKITDCYTYRHDIGAGMYAAVCDKMTMKKVMYRTVTSISSSPPPFRTRSLVINVGGLGSSQVCNKCIYSSQLLATIKYDFQNYKCTFAITNIQTFVNN